MAARYQGKKKTRRLKKRKPQKRRQQARGKKRRFQPKKHKKRRITKVGTRTMLNISSPRIFAAKILQNMPKVRMETKARGLMKTLLMDVYDNVSKEVETLSQNNEESTVSPSDVQAVLKEALTKELAKHLAEPTGSSEAAATATAA